MTKPLVFFAALAAFGAAPHFADADPKHCPPGHAKKGWCSPGRDAYRGHDHRREYIVIEDYGRYGLRPPREGYYYGVYDNDVYLISRATSDIIEGLGAVDYLLRRYGD